MYNGGNRPGSSYAYVSSIRHVAASVGRQTTLSGRGRQEASPGRSLPSPTAYCSETEMAYCVLILLSSCVECEDVNVAKLKLWSKSRSL